MRDLRAACIQSPPGDVVTAEYVDAVLAKAGAGIDLVVLPEMGTVPYFPLENDSLDAELTVALDGPEIAAFGAVAWEHDCHLMLGTYLVEGDRRRNAAVLFGSDGEILEGRTSVGGTARSYSKVHLCDVQLPGASFCETAYFDAGDRYVVWDTPMGCVGALICYDRHFPEAWVAVRELGAEIVGVPTTSGLNMEQAFVAEIQAMSLQQSVYALTANRVGEEVLRTSGRRTEFLGESCITGPFGEILAAAPQRTDTPLVTAELRAAELDRLRAAHRFHEHRRPDTYVRAGTTSQETTA
jgi:N-carbamoylputrescine amidase